MPQTRPLRPVALWCLCGLLFGGLLRTLSPELSLVLRPGTAPGYVDLFVAACAAVLLSCTGWLWIVVSVVIVSSRHGAATRWAGAPTWLRRGVVVLCGVTAVGFPAVATAHPASGPEAVAGHPPGAPDTPSLEGMTLPELPETPSAPRTEPRPDPTPETGPTPSPEPDPPGTGSTEPDIPAPEVVTPSAPQPRPGDTPSAPPVAPDSDDRDGGDHGIGDQQGSRVVVAPGDSLWSIARSRAPADATAAEIDRSWRAIWRANRDLIGDDPDLIRPGQRLDVEKES